MANYLDVAELLKIELPGKKVAMGRYDEILWKIRAGYLVVLAGALGFFVTPDSPLTLTPQMLALILWFGFVAWIIDVHFRRRQLRVVKAYNEIVTTNIKNLSDAGQLTNVPVELLHISGERLQDVGVDQDVPLQKCLMPAVFIYLGTSLVSILLLFVQNPG